MRPFFLLIFKLILAGVLVLPAPHILAEGKAYFWCFTQNDKNSGITLYYSKQFLAEINNKARYEEAFHTYIEAHYAKERFKGGATCQSDNVQGEARRERDEHSLTKRELYENAKIIITDWVY